MARTSPVKPGGGGAIAGPASTGKNGSVCGASRRWSPWARAGGDSPGIQPAEGTVAGEATGGAIARRFARESLVACVTRRTADKLAPLVASIEAAGGKARDLKRVVMWRLGSAHAIGFVTEEQVSRRLLGQLSDDVVAVYFPMSYQIGGYTIHTFTNSGTFKFL